MMASQGLPTVSRRTFCRWAAAGAAAAYWPSVRAAGQMSKVKFFKNLAPGHIGVGANQRQAMIWAAKYGFDSITPNTGEFQGKSAAQIRDWLHEMKAAGIRYGAAGLPVEFRRDEDRFRTDMAGLAAQAALLKQLGVDRVATWVLPGHNELTYMQNFEQHRRRFAEVAKVLGDHGIRLGLEFVGPRTSRARFRYPFACAQADMMELVGAIDRPNVGLLLDSWHWYTSHGTVDELMQLSNKDIVHVHVNDAPAGTDVDKQIDSTRCLPTATSVIDLKGFINALVKIGYDGPVECEPFDQKLREMDDEAAVRKTGESLTALLKLIEA